MSERGIPEFLKRYKKLEIAAAAGAAATIGATVAYKKIDPLRRHRRETKQLGLEASVSLIPLEERITIFGYRPGSEDYNDVTRLAACISCAPDTAEKGIAADTIFKEFGFTDVELEPLLKLLNDSYFITLEGTLGEHSADAIFVAPHADLKLAEEHSTTLQLAISDRLLEKS